MRLTDHQENPILSPCLAWFGGGGRKGPSKQENQAAKAEQAKMQQAAANQAKAQQTAQQQAAQQAAAQAAAQQQQVSIMEQQRKDALASQNAQIEEMKRQAEANKPAPAAQVDPGNPQADMAAEVAKRKGLRKSILAGESGQAPMTTGYSTLG
jgi:uncharacterized membrane protein YqiK